MDILEIIGKYGIEVPEDQADNLRKDVVKSYKSIAEYNKVIGERDTFKTTNQTLDSQVSALTTKVSEFENNNTKLTGELSGYINKDKTSKAGVDSSFVGYVTHEVSQLVTETKDFDTALNEYIANNQQFKAGTKSKVQTSPSLDGAEGDPKSTSQLMTEAILQGAGKKQ